MTHFRVQVQEFEGREGRKVRDSVHLKFRHSSQAYNLDHHQAVFCISPWVWEAQHPTHPCHLLSVPAIRTQVFTGIFNLVHMSCSLYLTGPPLCLANLSNSTE